MAEDGTRSEEATTRAEGDASAGDAPPSPTEETKSPDEKKAPQEAESETKPFAGPLPAANFTLLVTMFSTQAMVALGMIPNPVDGKSEPQLELARHFIDLLGVIEDKTRGNLDDAEHKLLDSTLHDLRMVYLELSK